MERIGRKNNNYNFPTLIRFGKGVIDDSDRISRAGTQKVLIARPRAYLGFLFLSGR